MEFLRVLFQGRGHRLRVLGEEDRLRATTGFLFGHDSLQVERLQVDAGDVVSVQSRVLLQSAGRLGKALQDQLQTSVSFCLDYPAEGGSCVAVEVSGCVQHLPGDGVLVFSAFSFEGTDGALGEKVVYILPSGGESVGSEVYVLRTDLVPESEFPQVLDLQNVSGPEVGVHGRAI